MHKRVYNKLLELIKNTSQDISNDFTINYMEVNQINIDNNIYFVDKENNVYQYISNEYHCIGFFKNNIIYRKSNNL